MWKTGRVEEADARQAGVVANTTENPRPVFRLSQSMGPYFTHLNSKWELEPLGVRISDLDFLKYGQ